MNNYQALSRLSTIDLQQYGNDTFGDGRLTPLYACDCYREEFVTLLKSIDKLEKYRWHDLRKDPNDLPENNSIVMFAQCCFGEQIGYGIVNFDENYPITKADLAWKYIEKL